MLLNFDCIGFNIGLTLIYGILLLLLLPKVHNVLIVLVRRGELGALKLRQKQISKSGDIFAGLKKCSFYYIVIIVI